MVRAQTAAPSTRVFALTTGTLGLIAVGILVLTITPRQQGSPIAISATTTTAAAAVNGLPAGTSEVPGTARPAALAGRGPATALSIAVEPALATPIGDGRMALITDDAMVGHNADRIAVRLPSGRTGSGRIVERSGGAWLIELGQAESGHQIARQRPKGSEIVTVMASPPVTIALADIATLDIDEGTAVLDQDGNLVGICSHRRSDGSVRLIEVKAEGGDATNAGP